VTEVLFYHLERQPLERVLPQLIGKTLDRGWRAVIQAGSEERVEALSAALWVTGEESFLPHGTARDGNADLQPVWITESDDNPNAANVRFLVDGARAGNVTVFERVVFLFDGRDAEAVQNARDAWKDFLRAGNTVTYWREDAQGRWQKQS
jgi:DNA polymerase III subunit chi